MTDLTGRDLVRGATAAAVAAIAAALAVPGAAVAATSVDLSGAQLSVTGDAFANEIEVRRVADGYIVSDPLARLTIETGAHCLFTSSENPPHQVKCLRGSEVLMSIGGGAGDDELTILGGTQGGVLDGAGGRDRLVGGPGPDTLRAGAGNDDLFGNGANDVMNGEGGPDNFAGGPGVDTVSYSDRVAGAQISLPNDSSEDRIDDGNLTDGPPGLRDSIDEDVENAIGGAGPDVIVGSDAVNVLDGRGGADQLFGRAGDDLLNGGLAADQMVGNDGFDLAFYGDRTVPVTVTLDRVANDGAGAPDQSIGSGVLAGQSSFDNVGSDVEGAIGGAAADTLIGDDGPNWLDGRGGADTIDGRSGDDDIDGGDGDDTLEGEDGADDVSGGAGRDSASYSTRRDPVSVSLDGVADDGGARDRFADNMRPDVENVSGTDADDVLVGSGVANLLRGFGGDDRLEGRGGGDELRGGSGTDLLDGGDGVGTASYEGQSEVGFTVGLAVTLDAVANDGFLFKDPRLNIPPVSEADNVLTENVTGGGGDNTIIGDDGPNVLSGGVGDDTLRGGAGNDLLDGGTGLDAMLGEAGEDFLRANDGFADQLDCGADLDNAELDLQDGPGPTRAGGGPLPASASCELQNVAPAGRLPNVALASRTVRVDRRDRAHLALRCPRRSQRRCAGTVRLQRLNGTGLGAARFAIRKGRRAAVTVRLRRPVRRGGARILARELDLDGRPKLTLARVRLRP